MLTSHELAVSQAPRRRALLVALLLVAFSAGMIAGALAVRAVEDPLAAALRPASTATMVPFKGVGDNDMTDAARTTLYAPMWFRGAAVNSMTDAARAATAGSWFAGVARHNMSDAARAARLPGGFRGVAENNMSDAADRVTRGSDR